MKIPFSSEELKRLLNIYEEEERDLRKKLKASQSTLRKIKEALRLEIHEESNLLLTIDEETEDVVTINNEKNPEEKYNIPKVPVSKRGRKPKKKKKAKTIPSDFDISQLNWRNFTITSIRNQNEIMSLDMLVDLAIRAYNLKAFPIDDIKFHIENTITELVEQEVIVKVDINEGNSYVGYSPWIAPNGDVKPEYLSTYKFSAEIDEEEDEDNAENEEENKLPENKWQFFITQTLKKTKKLHTIEEFSRAAIKQLDLTTLERDSLESLLEENIDDMLHSEILRRSPVRAGGYQYSLPHWFKKGDGKLKVYYMAHP